MKHSEQRGRRALKLWKQTVILVLLGSFGGVLMTWLSTNRAAEHHGGDADLGVSKELPAKIGDIVDIRAAEHHRGNTDVGVSKELPAKIGEVVAVAGWELKVT